MKLLNGVLCAGLLGVSAATDLITPDKIEADIKHDQ
jgi:hypothetical protein